ncbi:MAG TPA: hypothetical protein VKY74_24530 [Chloroflexia bacterium]|nr:hypothetical protein [Chloroflexia bacterium]
MFNVGDRVIWSGDNQLYTIIAVHGGTTPGSTSLPTYDIQLASSLAGSSSPSSSSPIQYAVPAGALKIAD